MPPGDPNKTLCPWPHPHPSNCCWLTLSRLRGSRWDTPSLPSRSSHPSSPSPPPGRRGLSDRWGNGQSPPRIPVQLLLWAGQGLPRVPGERAAPSPRGLAWLGRRGRKHAHGAGNSQGRGGSCQMSVLGTDCPEVGQGRKTGTSLWERKLPVDKWKEGETLGVNRFSSVSITQPASISWVLSGAGRQATCFVDRLSEWLPAPLGQVCFPARFYGRRHRDSERGGRCSVTELWKKQKPGLTPGQAGCGFLPRGPHSLWRWHNMGHIRG